MVIETKKVQKTLHLINIILDVSVNTVSIILGRFFIVVIIKSDKFFLIDIFMGKFFYKKIKPFY